MFMRNCDTQINPGCVLSCDDFTRAETSTPDQERAEYRIPGFCLAKSAGKRAAGRGLSPSAELFGKARDFRATKPAGLLP